MKIAFYSNFFTHHQLPFCTEMYKKFGDDFVFVSTEEIPKERIKLGFKNIDNDYPFVLKAYKNDEEHQKAIDLARNADVAIIGSTSTDEYGAIRLAEDKLTFRYYARIFYNHGIFNLFDYKNLKKVYERHIKYKKNKNLYMLAASGYSAIDFNKIGMYKNKCFKWGYFPEIKEYDINELFDMKPTDQIKIVWVGRFIKEKNPEVVIKLAKKLKNNGYNFKIQMIGNGIKFEKIKALIEKNNLLNQIELVGGVDSDKVREYMEKANIFICTSGKWERWGVVINEALNSGCAVVANKEIGAVPLLIGNNENGIAYKNFNELCRSVTKLINNRELRKKYAKNGYNVITNTWTAKNAVNNFEKLLFAIQNNTENPIKEGPGSIL